MNEMKGAFGRTVKLGRTGVQRALVERAAVTQKCEGEVIDVSAILFFFSCLRHTRLMSPPNFDAGADQSVRLCRQR
jgi:hypothetical protein